MAGSSQEKQRRRRGADLEEPIFDAVWDELSEFGWRDFQVNRVAKRARVNKTSIYSRWPERADLVRAALEHKRSRTPQPNSISGDLRGDLLDLLRMQDYLHGSPLGEAFRAVVSGPAATPERRTATEAVLDILRASGRVSAPETLPTVVLNLGLDLVSQHFLVGALPLQQDELEEIVDAIWIPTIERVANREPANGSP